MKKQISHIVNIQTGVFAKPEERGDVVYLQAKHFDENGNLQTELYPDIQSDKMTSRHMLKVGDVLFAAKGTKNFAAVLEKHNLPAVASTSFFVLRITDPELLPDYLAWFLNNPATQVLLKNKARGTSIPSIRKTDLDEMKITIPSIEKQKLIVRLTMLANEEVAVRYQIANLKKKFIEQEILKEINRSV